MAVSFHPDVFNCDNTRIMVTVNIGKHTVELYDNIDDLPIVRFHKYQKLLLIDSGIGSDLTALDTRLERVRRFILDRQTDKAAMEIQNLRQCLYFIQDGLNLRNLAFAVLVFAIDGKQCNDLSDVALKKICETFANVPIRDLTSIIMEVKKKIDSELMAYFPALFNDASIKEYYDIVKKRTLAILAGIINEDDRLVEIEKYTGELIMYSNPQIFSGSESAEIQFDRQFENLCLTISEQLNVARPKDFSVLEFYNAFDFLQAKAKMNQGAQKRPANRR